MSLQLRQHVATARVSPEGPAELSEIGVLVELPQPARLVPGRFDLAELETRAAADLAALAGQLPAALHPDLVAEAGALEQSVSRNGELLASRAVRYVISRCRGVVLSSDRTGEEGLPRWHGCRPWTGTVATGGLSDDLVTVLAPAALLALVLHVDAVVTDDGMGGQRWGGTGPLVVRDTASPYPPHTSPVDLVSGQPLGADELPPDPGQLRALFRPERWSRPAGSLVEDTVGSLLISCDMAPDQPERAVVMEELVPMTSGLGTGRWLAKAALCAGRDRLASTADLVLQLNPLRTLSTCRGALSGVQVAVVSNPLAGDRYGFAPWVLATERLRDLVG